MNSQQLFAFVSISTRLYIQDGMFDKPSLTKDVWHRFKVQTTFFEQDGQPWVRISANVYNTIEDYEKLANAILTLKAEETNE